MAGDRPVEGPGGTEGRESLDVATLLSAGADSAWSATGAQLVAVLSTLGIASAVLWQSLFVTVAEGFLTYVRGNLDTADPELQSALAELDAAIEALRLTLDLPIPVIVLGLVVLAVAGEAVMIAAVRAFAGDHLDGVPLGVATRRLARATLYGFLGGLVVSLGVGIGLLLVVVPGVVVYVATLVFRQEVAIADKGPLAVISGSWTLTKGNRWILLAVALVLWVVGYVAGRIAGLVPGTAGTVVHVAVTSAVGVFAVAVITEAYVRLRGLREGRDGDSVPKHGSGPATNRR